MADAGEAGLVRQEGEPLELSNFPTYKIAMLHQAMNAEAIEILNRVAGLGLGEWRIVGLIGSDGPATSRVLAERSRMDAGFISRTIKRLQKKNLVQTDRDTADRRLLHVRLTPEGKAVFDRTLPLMRARQHRLVEAVTVEEYAAFTAVIEKMDRVIAESRDSADDGEEGA